MRREHISELVCAAGQHRLNLRDGALEEQGEIKEGVLTCVATCPPVTIRGFVPRFVPDSGYAQNFGEQWNHFRRTQIDKFNGTNLSKERFYSGTGWSPAELKGAKILEAGCGAGRFTQIMLDAGAKVYSVDISSAVDACVANNGPCEDLCVVQADLCRIPFQHYSFDKVFCYGVLQHTPDPRASFMSLIPFLKPGGDIAVDLYLKGWALEPYKSKYLYRPLTTRMPRHLLFRFLQWYIPKWLPVDTFIKRLPLVGRVLGMLIPCWNYHYLPLSRQQKTEWGILDTFDALAPMYDYPQTPESVTEWFASAGLMDIRVRLGGNGVLGNGRARPLPV
ncbi:MAG: methyltransferase domain-containing protein [Nitrospira sp.]|nr:methyltransferase domain-containing protein [Nitrospira sp.]MBP8116088.1 methyltransferase domain-containing protein [Nitrospira sp.]